jgi:hypothetical protein
MGPWVELDRFGDACLLSWLKMCTQLWGMPLVGDMFDGERLRIVGRERF